MRYLILSDIHSNQEALSAVLSHVRRKRIDRTVFLGDLVGYGANPNQVVEKLRSMKNLTAVRGNHDKVCASVEDGKTFNRLAFESAMWTIRPTSLTWSYRPIRTWRLPATRVWSSSRVCQRVATKSKPGVARPVSNRRRHGLSVQ